MLLQAADVSQCGVVAQSGVGGSQPDTQFPPHDGAGPDASQPPLAGAVTLISTPYDGGTGAPYTVGCGCGALSSTTLVALLALAVRGPGRRSSAIAIAARRSAYPSAGST